MSDQPLHVLLIEDNAAHSRLIAGYLGGESEVPIQIESVDRLTKGLDNLAQSPVDVVLLDLNLPDSWGLDSLRRVLARAPGVAVVVLTAAEVLEDAVQAVREGATDYLFKTQLDAPVLIRAVRFAAERAKRRQAMIQLREAETRYRRLFEQSPDGILLVDPTTLKIVDFNTSAHRQLGYARREFQYLGLDDCESAGDRESLRQRVETLLTKKRLRYETTFRTKSGQLRDVVLVTQPLELANQSLLYVVFRDTTARKRAEIRLRESKERFRSLVETISDWAWEVNDKLVFTYCSPKVQDLLGYEAGDVVGMNLLDMVAPEDADRFASIVEKCRRSCSTLVRIEHTNLHRCGRHVVLETNATPIFDRGGQFAGYRGTDRDITEVKEAQDTLRERERRYRQLLAAVTNYTYSVSIDSGNSSWTAHGDGCVAVTGYSPGEYQADPGLWINMVHPEDRDLVRRHVERVLASEEVPPIEHRIVHRDGTTHWIRNTMVQHHENGRLVRYDGVVEDVTERKRAERALRQKELQLLAAQKIQERLLPREAPELAGFDIAGVLYPAEFTAGDYYDYLTMRDGTISCVIGDVSGHGFASALIMAAAHVTLRLMAESHVAIDEIFSLANSVLVKETEEGRFVSLLLANLDPHSATLVYGNAGHPPGYVLDAAGNVKFQLRSTGIPLGIMPDAPYCVAGPVTLDEGEAVVLVTDGIIEASVPGGEMFGFERVINVVRQNRHLPARQIAEELCRVSREFSRRKAPLDDTTAVVIKRLPTPQREATPSS